MGNIETGFDHDDDDDIDDDEVMFNTIMITLGRPLQGV